MNFAGDAFISYAHLDNIELVEGRKGWVANLQRALEIRVAQLLGKESRIWWDPKLHGNDYFADTLVDRLQSVAALVSVVSPRYVRSEWARREIDEFCRAAAERGGMRVGDRARLFKVLKTPVPLDDHPSELRSFLGYEFFKADPETGRVREFSGIFGPEAERDFWLRLDDLAHDVCCLLEVLGAGRVPAPDPGKGTVYLAVSTADMRDARDAIKRELEQHGYVVVPDRQLPLAASQVEEAVRGDLARCRMSIHLIGRTYSLVPEGGVKSLLEIQSDLAIERAALGSFSRLIWIRPGLEVDDARQRQVIEQLRVDPRISRGTDVLETPLEDLRTTITSWLREAERGARPGLAGCATRTTDAAYVYFIYDRRDAGAVGPWSDFLFEQFEVIHPVFDGDEADIRDYHEENLRTCDGVLIVYGAANECWLRRKLRELQKSPGYGRTKPMPPVGVCLVAPRTPEKERFRTHEAIVLPQWDGFSPDSLRPWLSLMQPTDPYEGDAEGPA